MILGVSFLFTRASWFFLVGSCVFCGVLLDFLRRSGREGMLSTVEDVSGLFIKVFGLANFISVAIFYRCF